MTINTASRGKSERSLLDTSVALNWTWAVPVAILLAGVFLRVHGIRYESIWMDEIACAKHLDAPTLVEFIHLERGDDPPMSPAYFTVAYFWGKTFESSMVSMRLLSILFSAVSMALLYWLARSIYGQLGAALALFCFAASPVHIFYAQEIRMYEFVLLLALVSALSLRGVLRSHSAAAWVIFTLSSVTLMWTHLFAVFLLFVYGIVLILFLRPLWRGLLVWGGICTVSFGGLLAWLSTMDRANLDRLSSWIPGPTAQTCHNMALHGCGVPIGSWPQYGQFDHISIVALILAAVCYLGWSVLRTGASDAEKARGEFAKRDYILLILWWVAPPVLLALVSITVKPSFVPRYMLYCSLALFVLLGGAVAALRPRAIRIGAAALVVLFYGYMAVVNTVSLPMRGDWQMTRNAIQATNHPKAPVWYVRASQPSPIAIDYYLVSQGYGTREFGQADEMWKALQERAALKQGTWVVFGENKEDYTQQRRFSELLGEQPLDYTVRSFPSARGVIWSYYFPGAR